MIRMPRKCNFGRVNSEGWFYITTISNLLSSIIHRHVNAWNKHVQYIPYHTPNHQRIYKGSHDQERRTRSNNGKHAAKGESTSTDGLIYIRRLIGHPQLSIKISYEPVGMHGKRHEKSRCNGSNCTMYIW